ncbi:hypothetical protein B0T26DRAFT_749809 [Lasiosphaeria miniovina]|uniref:Guanine nucleotide-exchange factor SEC12 n=1 Tax=Lasiosphaeria miniovina TaxID=1954250 RepID=A0AA40E4P1_9PEZI|nr:uncharacterized protein B0T26DRAFT_749809 [Lasiosphaeria miniovina]KAK0722403.1 hypothetical protein B0T26DRAFT_749809 [Lasiosphaeria miniovina]
MAPPLIPSAEIRLEYPLYSLDFDPQDANRIVVGGGGGPGRSGVSNKITVLDASHQDALQIVSDLNLSRDEDSVTTLAVGPRRRNSILVFTGINSSPADMEKGRNEHFRVFAIDPPSKTKSVAEAKIAELSRASLFTSKGADTYQRLLRISPPFPGSAQIGTAATGLAKDAQIVLFDVPATGVAASKPRGTLELAKEAMDLDLIQTGDDEWQLLYCDEVDIYTVNIKKGVTGAPRCVFSMPLDEAMGMKVRPTFRSIRYLTPEFVLAAANLPKTGGVVLQGFRLPKPELGVDGKARLAVSAKLHKSVTRATGLAVRNLAPPSTPSARQGDAQFVVAVTGQDSSITLYTLEHQAVGDISLVVNLYPVTTLKSVHPGPISGLAFSHFAPPKTATMRVHHVKLASIGSMGNTCVVHSVPLRRLVDKSAPARHAGPPRQPRYVVALKSYGPSATGFLIGIAVFAVVFSLFIQGLLEIKGLSRPVVGAHRVTPASWHADWKKGPREAAAAVTTPNFLAEYLGANQLAAGDRVVVLQADDGEAGAGAVKVDTHDSEQHGPAHEWDALPPAQQQAWKKALQKAGHWGEQTGDAIFKGILFGEIAGAVGHMVAG